MRAFIFASQKKSHFVSTYFREWQVFEHFASTYFCENDKFFKISRNMEFVLIWNLLWWKYCVHNHMQIRMRHSNHNFVAWKLKEENMANKNIAFSAAVRGFYVYKSIWKPEEGEKLMCYYEDGNPYMFSIKVCHCNRHCNGCREKTLFLTAFSWFWVFKVSQSFFPSPLHQIFHWNIRNMTRTTLHKELYQMETRNKLWTRNVKMWLLTVANINIRTTIF